MAGNGAYLVNPQELIAGSAQLGTQEENLTNIMAATTNVLNQLAGTWTGTGHAQFETDLVQWKGQVAAIKQTLAELNYLLKQAAADYGNVEASVTSSLSGRG